jgi:hypothetical protein
MKPGGGRKNVEQVKPNKANIDVRSLKPNVKQGPNHLCGLVVTVPGYRSRGSAFDSRRY